MSEQAVHSVAGFRILQLIPKLLSVLRVPDNWTDRDQVAMWLSSVADLFEDIAAMTRNVVDDKIAEYLRMLATNQNFIELFITLVEKITSGETPKFEYTDARAFVESSITDIDPAVIMMIVQLIIQVLRLIRK